MKVYNELVQSLDQLVTVYRHLLDIVRKENQVLVKADMKQIPEVNESKEKMVIKVRKLDQAWMRSAQKLSKNMKMKSAEPRLLEIASYFKGEKAQKLEQLHSVLNMLVQRIAEINKKNAQLAQSALAHINGAMDSITETLNENPTYKNSGGMEQKVEGASGRIVQREA